MHEYKSEYHSLYDDLYITIKRIIKNEWKEIGTNEKHDFSLEIIISLKRKTNSLTREKGHTISTGYHELKMN